MVEKCWDFPVPPHYKFLSLPSVPPLPHPHSFLGFVWVVVVISSLLADFSQRHQKPHPPCQGNTLQPPRVCPKTKGITMKIPIFSAPFSPHCHLQKRQNCSLSFFYFFSSCIKHQNQEATQALKQPDIKCSFSEPCQRFYLCTSIYYFSPKFLVTCSVLSAIHKSHFPSLQQFP